MGGLCFLFVLHVVQCHRVEVRIEPEIARDALHGGDGAALAGADAARPEAVSVPAEQQQRSAELGATQITQANADAEQNVIAIEASSRAEAASIRAIAEAEADAIRMKAEALR